METSFKTKITLHNSYTSSRFKLSIKFDQQQEQVIYTNRMSILDTHTPDEIKEIILLYALQQSGLSFT